MTNKCDKCGASTRWYDEKCLVCGAVQAVKIPTTPISLPNFFSSESAPREKTAVGAPQQEKQAPQNREVAQENQATRNREVAQEKQATRNREVAQEKQATQNREVAQEKQATQNEKSSSDEQLESPLALTDAPMQSFLKQRLTQLRQAAVLWRSTFNPNTGSVTLPPFRALRYTLGIAFELIVCPPCSLIAAYFFLRALRADRRADYHAALLETEKMRKTLAVGLGIFAIGLCAFIYYVHSQEIPAPTAPTVNGRVFR